MKLPEEAFIGKEVERVYLAGSLAEATRVENVLVENGVDFFTETEPYFVGEESYLTVDVGAGFYVLSDQAPLCRSLLSAAGLEQNSDER